ncbi:MAG: aldo/keto reductase [Candidatus Nanopelagicales bacterium]
MARSDIERLSLGTAQFGGHYGISNTGGEIQHTDAHGIIEAAVMRGITMVDTAPAYGEAESTVGRVLASHPTVQITTKLPSVSSLRRGRAPSLSDALIESLTRSLQRLARRSVEVVLVHDVEDLIGTHGPAVTSALLAIKSRGLAQRVGISAYTLEQVEMATETFVPDVVQLPINVYDQRLLRNRGIETLAASGVEVHARSIFLQGLILMSPEAVGRKFGMAARSHQEQFHAECDDFGTTPLKACIDFARQVDGLSRIVVGATSSTEIFQICDAADSAASSVDWDEYELFDGVVIDPAQWS